MKSTFEEKSRLIFTGYCCFALGLLIGYFMPSDDQQSDSRPQDGVGSNGLVRRRAADTSREDQGGTSPLGGDQPPNATDEAQEKGDREL